MNTHTIEIELDENGTPVVLEGELLLDGDTDTRIDMDIPDSMSMELHRTITHYLQENAILNRRAKIIRIEIKAIP